MYSLRSFLAVILSISLTMCAVPSVFAAHSPIGILTQANLAHLNEAVAYAGLSVFEGESLSTEPEGRLGVRAGRSTLTLGGRSEATVVTISGGMHVDLSAGSLYFSTVDREVMEAHVQDAMLRPASQRPTQAMITILSPKVLQIAARKGGLNFSYRDEFRNLPEGETYRIYLDAPAEPGDAGGASVRTTGAATKVAYFIAAAGAAGAASFATWGIVRALDSGNPPISPARP